jgi:uncharacterized membrane protein YkgB
MTLSQTEHRLIKALQVSIGIVYIWFGALKFFPHLSPAEDLAAQTIDILTFGAFSKQTSLVLLASWEVMAGILLIINIYQQATFWLVLVHMACTFVPLVFLPQISFTNFPYGLTLVGQYIVKNIVIIAALLVIRNHRKGNRIT